MSKQKETDRERETLRDVLRLQQRFVSRTANYWSDVGELVAAGSLEPREYIERSTKLWADMIGAVGDWLRDSASEDTPRPSAGSARPRAPGLPRIDVPIPRNAESVSMRIEDLDQLFERGSEDATFLLWIDGFTRRDKATGKKSVRRPAASIQREIHFRLVPHAITRDSPKAELKLFNLRDNAAKDDEYEGLLFAARVTATQMEPPQPLSAFVLKFGGPK